MAEIYLNIICCAAELTTRDGSLVAGSRPTRRRRLLDNVTHSQIRLYQGTSRSSNDSM